jgi:hypothetical protein
VSIEPFYDFKYLQLFLAIFDQLFFGVGAGYHKQNGRHEAAQRKQFQIPFGATAAATANAQRSTTPPSPLLRRTE